MIDISNFFQNYSTETKSEEPHNTTTKNNTSMPNTDMNNLWTWNAETELYNDIVEEDETFFDIIAKLGIEKLLEPSTHKITEIQKYLEENNVKYVSATEKVEIQSFTINDKQNILDNIYLKIIQLQNYGVLKQSVSRRPKVLKTLDEILMVNHKVFKNFLLDNIHKELLVSLIIKALSSMVTGAIETNNRVFKYATNLTVKNLGSLIVEAFMFKNFMYADYDNPDLDKKKNTRRIHRNTNIIYCDDTKRKGK